MNVGEYWNVPGLRSVKSVTFDFFGGFNILSVPLDGADESIYIWQVNLTTNKVLQALQAILEFPARPCLQMANLRFKCLKDIGSGHKYVAHCFSTQNVWFNMHTAWITNV